MPGPLSFMTRPLSFARLSRFAAKNSLTMRYSLCAEIRWFHALADTINGRRLSKNLTDCIVSMISGIGSLQASSWTVSLDEGRRPAFNDLLFDRRDPIYLPFAVLFPRGRTCENCH
jgi:hypothetical protein